MYVMKKFYGTVRGLRFGFEYSRVGLGDTPYLDRYILYVGGASLRLHKFFRGDDDRAPHCHPWAWTTCPLTPYWEKVFDSDNGRFIGRNYVKAFRWHRRPAAYRHIVEGRATAPWNEPFWTLAITGLPKREWGFWPEANRFVPWCEWS